MRGGGGSSCRRLRGAVAVPLQAAAAQQPVPGSGPWGGSRRGPARLLWLLRVTGRAGPGEGVRVRESGRGAEAGATTVARKGGGVTTWAEPSCAGANSRPEGVGGARSRRRPRSKAGLPKGAWPHPDLRHGAGLVWGAGLASSWAEAAETKKGRPAVAPGRSADLELGSLRGIKIARAFRLCGCSGPSWSV